MQSDPRHTGDVSHLLDQLSDMLLAVDIDTIIGQFLGNDVKLLRTIFHQLANLIENLLHRTTLMTPRNQRDGTIGAMTVTALRYLNISIMWWRRDMPMNHGDCPLCAKYMGTVPVILLILLL